MHPDMQLHQENRKARIPSDQPRSAKCALLTIAPNTVCM